MQSGADPAQSLAERAGAPLFEGMGDYHMPITTADLDAQRYFDQGMVLAFGFNHAESIRSFRAAQTLDPGCAMCFWGEALATGPNINVTSNGKAIMTPAERADARAAIAQALALTDGLTPKERDWVQALDQRYDGQPTRRVIRSIAPGQMRWLRWRAVIPMTLPWLRLRRGADEYHALGLLGSEWRG
jgi:hypothetical protein